MKNVKNFCFIIICLFLGGHPNRLFYSISVSYKNICTLINFNISLR